MSKNIESMLRYADSALIAELRNGTKEVCTSEGVNQATTIRLYKQAKDASKESLLVATMPNPDTNEIHYVHVHELQADSLVVFEVTTHEISSVSKLESVFAESANRSMKISDKHLVLVNADSVTVYGDNPDSVVAWGFEIGKNWFQSRIKRFVAKGKRNQWKFVKDTSRDDSVAWSIDYNADKRNE